MYVDFVNSNTENIASYVNACFETSKDFIRAKLIRKIREYITPLPIHYVHHMDNNPYDCSGVLVEDGIVTLNQTIMDFLENEYTGNKIATYTSGMGWQYYTYGDELHYYTIELAADIMFPAIQRCVEKAFSVTLSDEDFAEIKESCYDFDEIYDNCIASDFFYGYPAIEFAELENVKLARLVKVCLFPLAFR